MWKKGNINVSGRTIEYWIKTFEIGSQYGISRGRILKLMLKRDGEIIANYDRGWDIKPIDSNAESALMILMKEYN